MMDLPVQDSAEEEDGKPVVLLEESPKALELYLRLIVGEEKMDLLETFEEIMSWVLLFFSFDPFSLLKYCHLLTICSSLRSSVLPLAEKYESHLVLNLLLPHLRPHVYSHSKTIFPLACIHGHLTLAKRALEYFSGTAVVEKAQPSRSDFLTGRWRWQGENASLDEIPKDLFERIPLKIVEKLQKLQARITKGGLRWADVADELKVRSSFVLDASEIRLDG